MNHLTLMSAIQCIEDARRALVALYLDMPHYDPAYERAVAVTPVPPQYADLSKSLHATHDHLLNLRDELSCTTTP